MSNPRDIAALIVSKNKGEPVSPSQENTDSADEMATEAAGEIMDCMKSDDKEGFAEALKSFIQAMMP